METKRIRANGLEFAVDVWGEGDTVALLLHGFPESRVAWRGLAPKLAELGWRVAAPDMRGYGDSDKPRERSAYGLDALTADVAGLFEALGARRRVLIGHDWGGIVAWAAAMRPETKLDGLVVLNAPHPERYRQVLRSGLSQLLRSWYVLVFQLPGLPEMQMRADGGRGLKRILRRGSQAIPEEALETYAANILKPGAATAMINYYRANARTLGSDGWGDRVETPTLLLWGEADPHLGPELARGNEGLVPDLTVRTLPGVSHWIEHEAPDAVMAGIADWAAGKGLAG